MTIPTYFRYYLTMIMPIVKLARSRRTGYTAAAALFVLLLMFSCSENLPAGSPVLDCSGFSGQGSSEDTVGWLEAHNKRRKCYYEHFSVSHVPLKWSAELAASSQQWADRLVSRDSCNIQHCSNVLERSQCPFGENLAFHRGTTQTADQILHRWTEDEAAENGGHFTQVLWRPTQYVGCGWATGACGEVQVCRYIKPGNCNRLSYLVDDSPCGPECPPEGCG